MTAVNPFHSPLCHVKCQVIDNEYCISKESTRAGSSYVVTLFTYLKGTSEIPLSSMLVALRG
jgi:hypothetical protein